MINQYFQHKLYAIAMLFLVIGGLNWGYVAFTGKDFISYLFGKGMLTNTIFLVVGIVAIAIAFYRDTYLPFLGSTVIPCHILQVATPEQADFEVKVLVKPGAKVLFWAAEPENKDLQTLNSWKEAYLSYRNAGVSMADNDGYASLKVRKPQAYTVPLKGKLNSHIHYRVCYGGGFMGPVETVTLDGKEYFENMDDEEPRKEYCENMDDEEPRKEYFENMDDAEPKQEFFKNMEEQGPVQGIASPTYPNSQAIAEVNTVAEQTALRSLMPQSGAILESPQPGGYDLEEAYAVPQMAAYTSVNYR
jgi:uncharacterized membrane protein YuzA (DUF378 family)